MSEPENRRDCGMSLALLNDTAHWQGRAEETRRMAENMADPEAKRMMLNIANDYDRLVEHAEKRLLTENTLPK